MDWVVQGETYGLDSPPYIMEAGQANDEGDIRIIPLTMHPDINSFTASREPALEQTVVRVRGTIQWWLVGLDPDAPPVGAWILDFHMRIAVTTQQPFVPTPVQETALQYDMRRPEIANDDFLWESKRSMQYIQAFWSANAGPQQWLSTQVMDIDVRVSRRLRQREVLALFLQTSSRQAVSAAGAVVFTATTDTRLCVEPTFRTLVRTIT